MGTQFDFNIEPIQIKNGTGFVVRDDLLEGGTKQRAIVPYLQSLQDEGFQEFVYASPFSGFAQVAMASALEFLEIECTVFCEPTPSGKMHRFSELAAKMGAKVILCDSLGDAETRSHQYTSQVATRFKLPLGFNDFRYRNELSKVVDDLWLKLSKTRQPQNLWLPVGSGTLAQVFRKAIEPNVKLQCVDVHVLKEDDDRINRIRSLENVAYHSAELRFHEECLTECPVPSNSYYDSKVFEVFYEEGSHGDVWWNVAK